MQEARQIVDILKKQMNAEEMVKFFVKYLTEVTFRNELTQDLKTCGSEMLQIIIGSQRPKSEIFEDIIHLTSKSRAQHFGEFYTPKKVADYMSSTISTYIPNKHHLKIYDPTAGSGTLLVSIFNYLKNNGYNVSVELQGVELNRFTSQMCDLNLQINNVFNYNIFTGSTFDFEHEHKKYDIIVSNPPYSTKANYPKTLLDGYSNLKNNQCEVAFLLDSFNRLSDDGIMYTIMPINFTYSTQGGYDVRKMLVDNNYIHTIVYFPKGTFKHTDIKVVGVILRKNKTEKDIFLHELNTNLNIVGYNIVDVDQIRDNNYNLNYNRWFIKQSHYTDKDKIYIENKYNSLFSELVKLHNIDTTDK